MENFILCSKTLYDKDLLDKSYEICNLKSIMSIMIDSLNDVQIYELGVRCVEEKKNEEAIYFFKYILQKYESCEYIYDVYSRLGRCYCYKKNWKESLYYHKKAVDLSKYNNFTYFGLARVYFFMKEYSKAIDIAQIILKNAPENKDAYIILGGLYRLTGENQKAMEIYESALKIYPEDKQLVERINMISERNTI